jgi:hypothetical protein
LSDTIRISIYKDRYRDRFLTDTFIRIDTIHNEIYKEKTIELKTNELTSWQWFQVWLGRLLGLLLIIFIIIKIK